MKPIEAHVEDRPAWGPALWAALAGLIVFSLLVDPSIINPFQVDWLAKGDPAQSYLGWLFFRHEPWTLPLGLAHSLGMEQANSIVYSDSIPLLAIPLKLLSRWLPEQFQYHGVWLFSCYALQGYFACRLLMLFSVRRMVVTGGVLLFLLSPIMLLRAQSHFALTAHWIVVAALYLYYAPPSRRRMLHWLLLLWLAAWVHAYLMVMAYAIWAGCVLRYALIDRRGRFTWLPLWAVCAPLGSLVMMWLAGYFGDMEVSSGGFGYYSMNLLAPLFPIDVGPFLMGAPAPATAGQYEGFNYLGLGVLVALLLGAWQWLRRQGRPDGVPLPPARATEWPLLLCCLVLTIMAVSNVVTFGSRTLFTLTLPPSVEQAMNVFRASGRLFWPVYYLLLLSVARMATRLSAPLCARMMLVVVALQVIDLWPFMASIHHNSEIALKQNHFPVFNSPFWRLARARYSQIYVIPGNYQDDSNIAYESLAGAYGFDIDSAYYARMPSLERTLPRQRRHTLFYAGKLDPHGLYLVQPEAERKFAAVERLLPPATAVGKVDGFTVVAPRWLTSGHAGSGYLVAPERHDFSAVELGREIHFGSEDKGALFALAGWSEPGDHALWSVGTSAVLAFNVQPRSHPLQVTLEVMPYLPAASPRLGVDIRMDGQLLAHWQFERGRPPPVTTIAIPPAALAGSGGNVALHFSFDLPRSPLNSGESADPRELALLLKGLRVE